MVVVYITDVILYTFWKDTKTGRTMQEIVLYERWQQLALYGETIHCGGHTLQVLHSGRLNTARGPDFRSARFRLDGVIFQGDVGCHCKYQDWYHHQHDLDPAFADVLLHIVGTEGSAFPAVNHVQNPHSIPTLSLPALRKPGPETACPISPAHLPLLAELALKRFHLRKHRFQALLQSLSAEQIFYEYFLRALGYSANGDAFQLLARRLPWSWLSRQSDRDTVCAVYAGTAGFLPAQKADTLMVKYLKRYRRQSACLDAAPLAPSVWQFAGVRPYNHPHFRLAGWAHLVFRRSESPFRVLYHILSQRLPYLQAWACIQSYLQAPCPSYWQTHYGFGLARHSGKARYFFGKARIGELLINLVLPLFSALASESGSIGFERYLEAFYQQLPATGGYTRFKKLSSTVFQKQQPTLALYQGLFYLDAYYCRARRCSVCPVHDGFGSA